MGGQAQVVTFALDWLLEQGEPIRQVVVLHLAPDDPRIQKALDQLTREFSGARYAGRGGEPIRLHTLPIGNEAGILRDIRTDADAEITWQAVYRLIAQLKNQQHALHVCIAGGRRIMGLMAMSAAMLHFDHNDRLWHLFAPDDLRRRAYEGAVMHVAPADGVRLIQVPISPWGAYFPGLHALVDATPARVMNTQREWVETDERARCRRVTERLTERQVEVLKLFAVGQTPQQVAEALNITLKTVDTHKTAILDHCRNEWQTPAGGRLDYHFLRDKFKTLFAT